MTWGPFRAVRLDESGFTLIEAMTAAVILVVAIVLTITPIAVSMRAIDRSKEVTVAENLAQARIEEARSLDYADVGNPGFAPDGILDPSIVRTVDGRDYVVTTDVRYVGATTGLDIVAQGGDGVQGSFDPGVNYKLVTVTVTSSTGAIGPVTMETIVAPPTIGALEDVAIVSVSIERHEPYDPSSEPDPWLQLVGTTSYLPHEQGPEQIFPDVVPGTYTIDLFDARGWQLHPDTIATGANTVDAVGGWNAQRTIRVYRPASLTVTVLDDTGVPIPDATITITDMADGRTTTNTTGDYVFTDLVPDRYSVNGSAPGYLGSAVEVDVPGPGGGTSASVTLVMTPYTAMPVDMTFHVDYAGWSTYFTAGATVTVSHPVLGSWTGTTDENGDLTLTLPENETGYTVTAETGWGHAPTTTSFATTTAPATVSLSLGKPTATDRFALYSGPIGPTGFYRYWVETWRNGRWRWSQSTDLPSNSLGKATFIVPEANNRRVHVRAYCDTGTELARATFTMTGANQSWNVPGSCP